MTDFDPRSVPVRFSSLKHFSRSAAHYRAALTQPHRDTPAMRLGRLVDSYVFGGVQPVVYQGERRGNAWKDFVAQFEDFCGWCGATGECPITCPRPVGAQQRSPEIVTQAEADQARRCADSILGDVSAASVLQGSRWTKIAWQFLGRDCVSHPDLLMDLFAHYYGITDLKTTTDAEPHHFVRHALKMQYHAQLAFYEMACVASGRTEKVDDLYLVVAEINPPFAVCTFRIGDRARQQGHQLCRAWMEQLLIAEQSGHWGGYTAAIEDLELQDDYGDLTFADDVEVA